MSCSMLYKSSFVTKSVVAVFSHAMEVSLMFSVVATLKSTILIEPEPHVSFWHRFIFQHSHTGLQPHLLLLRIQGIITEDVRHGTRPFETVGFWQPREVLQSCRQGCIARWRRGQLQSSIRSQSWKPGERMRHTR